YIHVFDWKKDGQIWLPLTSKVAMASLLAAPERTLQVTPSEGGTAIKLAGDAPDKIASVIVAEMSGPVQAFVPRIRPSSDGTFNLDAVDADVSGDAKLISNRRHRQMVSLAKQADVATWPVTLASPGRYDVEITYFCDAKNAGSDFAVT